MENLAPSDAIEAAWLETYEKQRNVIWQQLVDLNCNIFLIEKIEKFPLKLFLPLYDDRVFWQLTKNALIEKSIMIICRVIIDVGSDCLTIRHFKNELRKHLRDDGMKKQFDAIQKNIDFEKRMVTLEGKVKHARNNYLAHLNREMLLNPNPQKIAQVAINLTELKELLSTAHEFFLALCFDQYYEVWPWAYLDGARERRETDIDMLLDSVAENSYILNMPEDQPEFWEIQKQNYSENDLATLNEYRRKFNLTAV